MTLRILLRFSVGLAVLAFVVLIFSVGSSAVAQRGGGGEAPTMRMTDVENKTTYINMSRVTNTAEEFVVDLAFLDEPALTQTRPAVLRQRIVLSPYAAKRLMMRLESSLKVHEDTFGEIELDVRKRAQNKNK